MQQDPTYVVERSMFLQNQFPYLEVRRPFILGTAESKWKATISHHFVDLLHKKTDKLRRLFTQNIDGLDYQLDLPDEKIVPVHGSIGKVVCEKCGHNERPADFCSRVKLNIKDIYGIDPLAPKESTNILCLKCKAPTVKPGTVLFGSSLPEEFFKRKAEDLPSADLVIISGTSLVVSPANSIASEAPSTALRLVVNNEAVGEDLGIRYGRGVAEAKDLFAQGNCDDIFLRLIDLLGWRKDLEARKDVLPEASLVLLKNTGLHK